MVGKTENVSHSWVYDRTNVFVFALHIYPFHLMFRVMNTSIMGTPCDISFYWKDGALEKLCLRSPKSLIWHCEFNQLLKQCQEIHSIQKEEHCVLQIMMKFPTKSTHHTTEPVSIVLTADQAFQFCLPKRYERKLLTISWRKNDTILR